MIWQLVIPCVVLNCNRATIITNQLPNHLLITIVIKKTLNNFTYFEHFSQWAMILQEHLLKWKNNNSMICIAYLRRVPEENGFMIGSVPKLSGSSIGSNWIEGENEIDQWGEQGRVDDPRSELRTVAKSQRIGSETVLFVRVWVSEFSSLFLLFFFHLQ